MHDATWKILTIYSTNKSTYISLAFSNMIPAVAQSKAWARGYSLPEIAGSNPAEGHGHFSCDSCVLYR